ncbi:gamma-butyrobetaine hydroxylase-like domain-containing protein, partial [Rhizobium ruizarguesonis]
TVPGKRNVAIISMMPTGNYAVLIGFDDMHDTGIYTWTYLRELGERVDELFSAYEDDAGQTGERQFRKGAAGNEDRFAEA